MTGVQTCALPISKLVYPDGRVQSNCQRFPNIFYNLLELLRFQKLFPKWGGRLLLGSFFDYSEQIDVDWTWGAFFMFPKTILSKMPGNKLFDGFFMYCEDMWWCWDIKKCGYKICFLPQGQVIHFVGGSLGPKNEESEKNLKFFIKSNYSVQKRLLIQIFTKLLSYKFFSNFKKAPKPL